MRLSEQTLSAVFLLVLGSTGIFLASGYRIGTLWHMGPAYFPLLVSAAITLIGLILAVQAWRAKEHTSVGGLPWRGVIFLFGSLIAFGLSVHTLGLIPAVVLLVVISCIARPDASLIETAAITAVLTVIAVVIFSYGLRIPVALWALP